MLKLVAATGALAFAPFALVLMLVTAVTGGLACTATSDGSTVVHNGDVAGSLVRVARATRAGDKATLALVEAGLVESGMTTGSAVREKDRDSVGPLQQRPSQGWGSAAQSEDPVYAARAFLLGPARAGAADPNAEVGAIARATAHDGTAGELAQAVQRSAVPDEYDKREAEALALIAQYGAIGQPQPRPVSPAAPNSTGGLAWGGYSNGQIPLSAMTEIARGHHLRPDAAVAWDALQAAASSELGHPLAISDSYRPLHGPGGQYATKAAKGRLAATPGTSRHGWGLALDISVGSYVSIDYRWLARRGPEYGWVNPAWARQGGSLEEPWHWEFQGDSGVLTGSSC